MDTNKLKAKFEKIEKQIALNNKKGLSTKELLKKKIIILKNCYGQLSDALNKKVLAKSAPNFAKELAFLNNIKEIQTQLNEHTNETDAEIQKIYDMMKDNGFSWLLENMPKKIN